MREKGLLSEPGRSVCVVRSGTRKTEKGEPKLTKIAVVLLSAKRVTRYTLVYRGRERERCMGAQDHQNERQDSF